MLSRLIALWLRAAPAALAVGAAATACAVDVPADVDGAADHDAAAVYRLAVRDLIEVTVFDEDDLATSQRIDPDGNIRLRLIGTVLVAGRSVREAEALIQQEYINQRFLRQPMVTIRILEYAPREAMVNGAVHAPQPFVFPPEASAVDIVEVITRCGGFTDQARDNAVRVTRFSEKGRETFVVKVRDMLLGRTTDHFLVLPGDVVYVDD